MSCALQADSLPSEPLQKAASYGLSTTADTSTSLISFNPYNKPMRWILLLPVFSKFPKITALENREADPQSQDQECLTPEFPVPNLYATALKYKLGCSCRPDRDMLSL